MTRKRKFLTAGLILVLGIVLAWPFHKSADDAESFYRPTEQPAKVLRASNGDPIASVSPQPMNYPITQQPVVAHMASTNDQTTLSRQTEALESFDLANHPVLSQTEKQPQSDNQPPFESRSSTDSTLPTRAGTDDETRPAYSTITDPSAKNPSTAWRPEVIHIVANGDTLEKLAERYLNDAGRALEIFDLNRDQLSNPHLLPIGVELRVPIDPDRIVD